jgi:predicted metallopeptidase
MNKEFTVSEDLKKLAEKVIQEKKLDYLNNVRITYLLVLPQISKTCIARCIKAGRELEYFAESDYIIEFSQDIWEKVDDKIKEIVIYHELLHILLKTSKKGETQYRILDHNVKDFSQIISKYGIDWFNSLQVMTSSIRDLETTEQDNLSI